MKAHTPRKPLLLCSIAAALLLAAQAATAGESLTELTPAQARLPQLSLDLLQARGGAAGLERLGTPQLLRVLDEADGSGHVHWQPTLRGVPIWGGDFILHVAADGRMKPLTGARVPNLRRGAGMPEKGDDGAGRLAAQRTLGTQPLVSEAQAIRTAEATAGCTGCLTAPTLADLWVMVVEDRPRLAWRLRLRREDGSAQSALPVVFVDALDGAVLGRYDNLQTAQGQTLYSGTVAVETSSAKPRTQPYYLEDLTRRLGVFNLNRGTSVATATAFSDSDDLWYQPGDPVVQRGAVDTLYGMTMIHSLLQDYGRMGIDGNNGPGYRYASATRLRLTLGSLLAPRSGVRLVSSYVHYGNNYNNAYWSGDYMVMGDGDGNMFSPLVSIDIIAHEMMHGVTERTAGLVYSGQSGALNESWSDVFGALAERRAYGETSGTWQIGEQAYTPGTERDALRYMDDPTRDGYSIDHYSKYPQQTEVHGASGIANNAFYLAAHGGINRTSGLGVEGIGADAAGQIWYRALAVYMSSSTTFAGARTATVNAATDLFGVNSPQYCAVGRAWTAVGVGGPSCGIATDPH